MRRTVLTSILFVLVLSAVFLGEFAASGNTEFPGLTAQESDVVSLVNGTSAYDYDLELERIALDHNLSDYSFRTAGSRGANQTANWILRQLQSLGLQTALEPFEFTTWNLPSQPTLTIDQESNPNTTDDQIIIKSFQSTQMSWPTPEGGIFADLVILPLPDNVLYSHFSAGSLPPYNASAWIQINTTGKILLIGREVNWFAPLRRVFEDKISSQPPAALIYTYWYSWMNFTPPMQGSMAGHRYWSSRLPLAWVNYDDGLWIRSREASVNVSARVEIPAVIGSGTHYNVVGKLTGSTNPEKAIIISGHYDTVMDAGFCDNGAGAAGVIELARAFMDARARGVYTPPQTLIFVAFTGEELGFVGAIAYIKQHKAEMNRTSAVINLDCIGQGNLTASETLLDENGLELDETVLKAARDLNVNAAIDPESLGGSDQEAFRNPIGTSIFYREDWGTYPDINDTARVKSSTMLCSTPLFYNDKWLTGSPGWIHTEYDNSTSTVTLNWVNAQDLEAHLKVAALSVVRVLSVLYNPFMSQVLMGSAIAFAIVAALIFIERSRVKSALARMYGGVVDYMETKEYVYVFLLMAFLLFSSYAMHSRLGRTEIMVNEVPTLLTMQYFGTPFEMLGIPQRLTGTQQDFEFVTAELTMGPESGTPVIIWPGLLLNIVVYFLAAFGIVYLALRVWYAYGERETLRVA